MSKEKNKLTKTDKYAMGLLSLGVILLLVLPWAFTRSGAEWLSFRDTGPIGDTIGGVTAPFMSLIGGGLVYLALREQIRANKIITDQFEQREQKDDFQFLLAEIQSINTDIQNLSFVPLAKDRSKDFDRVSGKLAIEQYLHTTLPKSSIYTPPQLTEELMQIFDMFSQICLLFINTELSLRQRNYISSKIFIVFRINIESKFNWTIYRMSRTVNECDHCGEKHGYISCQLFHHFDYTRNEIARLNAKYSQFKPGQADM